MDGCMGRIGRVNLSNGTVAAEPLNRKDANLFIGGKGLGTKLYMNETDAAAQPFSPENKLIFMTGPLTGTLAAGAGSCEIITKAPLTGEAEAVGIGGRFGPELKSAGFDGLILEGRADKPVYLYIHARGIELRDASRLWGRNIPETADWLAGEAGEDVYSVCIGPAGENQVSVAVITSDPYHSAGSSGFGAVMGSKNLKAIVVKGSEAIRVAKQKEFFEKCLRLWKAYREDSAIGVTECFGTKAAEESDILCAQLGLDPAAMNAAIQCARALYDKGCAVPGEIGTEFPSDSTGSVARMIRMTSLREGFGGRLAAGARELALSFGHPELAVSAMRLNAGPAENVLPAAETIRLQNLKAVAESAGIRFFSAPEIGLPMVAELIRCGTGLELSDTEVLQAGERVWNLERLLSLKCGAARNNEKRPEGSNANVPDQTLRGYYSLRGWDLNGIPTRAKRKELSID